MILKEQSEINHLLSKVPMPRMYTVHQHFDTSHIEDVVSYVREHLAASDLKNRIRPGMRVVLTGSSRQISNANTILREIASYVKSCGAFPVIVPGMGSHGGATAEGQKEILDSFGITEEYCGCPIYSSMETVELGHLDCGDTVYFDRFAAESDAIIVVGRIKAHTAFRGPYESGLVKMMAIGLGKQKGADSLHQKGFGVFAERLPAYAQVIMEKCNIVMGIGIVENAFDETCRIAFLNSEDIFEEEPKLLAYSKTRLPQILLPESDLMIVREIGKNFSGLGMDPNVTGSFGSDYATGGHKKQRTAILDIHEKSHGNFIGLGLADVTTKRAFDKLDTNAAYLNMLTSTIVKVGKIPMVLETDEMAIRAALKVLTGVDPRNPRVVYLKNTLSLGTIMVSEALLPEVRDNPALEIDGTGEPFHFDREGNLLDLA